MPAGSILVADDDTAIRTVLNQALSRAGYEVRVLPEEGNSFEDNPPTLIEFLPVAVYACDASGAIRWRLMTPPPRRSPEKSGMPAGTGHTRRRQPVRRRRV